MKNDLVQEVLKYTFGEVNEELNVKFGELRNKIFNSVEYSYENYDIYTTIINKDELKIFENNFSPVILEDLKESNLLEKIVSI